MEQFPKQKRGGMGVKAIKVTPSRGRLVAARSVAPGDEVFITSSDGIVIRTPADSISLQKRDASGVKVMNLEDGSGLTSFTVVPAELE